MKPLKEYLFITVSVVLLVLPYHFAELWPLAFFAFVPYFLAVSGKSPSEAFKSSYLLGFLVSAGIGYWLALVNEFGFIFLVVYLALYFGVFGYLTAAFIASRDLKGIVYASALWVALEYVRGWLFGGLPWAILSYSQWKNVYFIQAADWVGAFGVSYLVMLINLSLFRLLVSKKRARVAMLLLAGILLPYLYGAMTLQRMDAAAARPGTPQERRLRVSVVQGNIPQDQKWNAKIKSIIFEKYKRLTFMAAIEKADLIVWPETSFPGYLEDEPLMAARLRSMIRQSKADVLVGAPTMGNLDEGLKFFNSAVLYGAGGEEKKRYHKSHLVPFGEYIPFEPLFGILREFVEIGHFSAGEERTIFIAESHHEPSPVKARFATLICFEDIFPALVRDFSDQGVDFLVNITNDAWFGKTAAPYQHAAASVFRAVENRLPMIRAANTGLSCVISPEGRVLATVRDRGEEIFVTGQTSYELLLRKNQSFYTRFGDLFFIFTLLLCYLAYRERKKQAGYAQL